MIYLYTVSPVLLKLEILRILHIRSSVDVFTLSNGE
jgi:hypothetical protein